MSASNAAALTDEDGFVDTGDMVELRGDRYHFVGRRGGIINIGGLKVHPRRSKPSSTGTAEVRMSRAQIAPQPDHRFDRGRRRRSRRWLRREPQRRDPRRNIWPIAGPRWPSHKVPAVIRFVEALDVTPAGKLARSDA